MKKAEMTNSIPYSAAFQVITRVNGSSVNQSGIVIRFDNHMTSQRGGHSKIREFSYSLRFACYLFDYNQLIYP